MRFFRLFYLGFFVLLTTKATYGSGSWTVDRLALELKRLGHGESRVLVISADALGQEESDLLVRLAENGALHRVALGITEAEALVLNSALKDQSDPKEIRIRDAIEVPAALQYLREAFVRLRDRKPEAIPIFFGLHKNGTPTLLDGHERDFHFFEDAADTIRYRAAISPGRIVAVVLPTRFAGPQGELGQVILRRSDLRSMARFLGFLPPSEMANSATKLSARGADRYDYRVAISEPKKSCSRFFPWLNRSR